MSQNLHRLTPRPPMGWNSYDSFGCFINEKRALENLAVFVERLKPHGYEYFVIDAGWFRQYELAGREFPGKSDANTVRHDEYGRLIPLANFFPGASPRGTGVSPVACPPPRLTGLRAGSPCHDPHRALARLADACHAAGFKFGLHRIARHPAQCGGG